MARSNNLPAKKYKAGERTERTLRFRWDCGDGGADAANVTTVYIDIAQALSQINRRAYRQGLYYYVNSVGFSNGTEAYCQINTLPDTWMTKVAWIRGYRKWMEMNRRANDHSNVTPKFHDFKTQMINGATVIPCAYGDVSSTSYYSSDDWVISKFVTDDPYLHGGAASDTPVEAFNGDQFTSHMLGPHVAGSGSDVWTSVGLIRSLNDVYRYPAGNAGGDPELDEDADTDPIANLFDSSDTHDDVRENMNVDNDEPPYDHDAMVGASSVEETSVAAIIRVSDGGGGFAMAGGFCAPLGLLQVNVGDFGTSGDIDIVEMIVEVAPGPYHGVYAERVI